MLSFEKGVRDHCYAEVERTLSLTMTSNEKGTIKLGTYVLVEAWADTGYLKDVALSFLFFMK